MKIKTITCHDVYNYGATLQAYSLMKYLQNNGNEVEIINYKPEYLDNRYKLWKTSKRFNDVFLRVIYFLVNLARLPSRLLNRGRKYRFDKFTKEYLCVTDKRYKSNSELKYDPPYADLYIAGSDQIWNTLYPNGKDPAFYLDFAPKNAVKASYAASFATDSIMEGYEEFVKEKIETLDYVAVRERKGLEILKELGINSGKHVLDPVFLLSKEQWSVMIEKTKISSPYILIYDFENNPIIEESVKKLKNHTGYKTISINDWFKNPYADVNIKHAGPKEFLTLIYNTEIFLSNSFHGTAFSVIFQKEFYVFKRMIDKVNCRMIDFLETIGISNRLIDSIESLTLDSIDYKSVNKLLMPHIESSKQHLRGLINSFWLQKLMAAKISSV